jgi:phosphoglycerol geranylgeranyltransferase
MSGPLINPDFFSSHPCKGLAVLVDPDHGDENSWTALALQLSHSRADLVLVGGSYLTRAALDQCVVCMKKSGLPVVLFPGSFHQVTAYADAILLLSVISGRNAELLIGQHVLGAPLLKAAGIPIFSTGYMIVDSGRPTTVSYVSQSLPLPQDKPGLAAMTALAGEQLGMKLIYMDAGSGAQQPIPLSLIQAVKAELHIPLIVGGGINQVEQVRQAWHAGADWVVVGTAIEQNQEFLSQLNQLPR